MAAPNAPALELTGAAFPFGDGDRRDGEPAARDGLTGVDLAVAQGERLVLVGPSGVGKTTLLKGIAGLVPMRAGRVRVQGEDVTGHPPEARGAVYLHQSPVLFPHRTVAGNVAFPLEVRGASSGEIARRVAEALDAVHLGGLASRSVRGLSGGERHRVALARAVVARPPLLLLDEPLAALDPGLRSEVREAILVLQTHYAPGLVLVTHDLADVGHLAHRVGVVLEGRLAQVATPETLFQRPDSLAVARFLGMGPELTVTRAGAHWHHAELGAVAPVRGVGTDGAEGASRAVAILPPAALSVSRLADAGGMTQPSGPRSARAVLERIQYPGPGPAATLRVGSDGPQFSIPLHGPDRPQMGDEVLLSWDPNQVLVFPMLAGD